MPISRDPMAAAAKQRLATRDVGAGVENELSAGGATAYVDAGAASSSISSVCSIITTASAPRGIDSAGRNSGRGSRHYRDCRIDAAGNDLSIERETFWRAVARPEGIGSAHREPIDTGAVEWWRIDQRNHVGRKHARQRGRKRHGFAAQWGTIDAAFKAPARFRGRDHIEELLLPRRAAYCIQN